MIFVIGFVAILLIVTPNIKVGRADQEASNRTHIRVDQWGQLYAKSIPFDRYGTRGITKIYEVGHKFGKEDTLLHTYDWFASKLHLAGWGGYGDSGRVYVVQMGPWARGHEASSNHLAIAFHKNGELLKRYTTLDIVGDSKKIESSISHYTVFSNPGVVRGPFGNTFVFDITTHDGQKWTFDLETGKRLLVDEELERK